MKARAHAHSRAAALASTRAGQRGFAAIAALFLVVTLAAMGGFMLTFSNTQQLTSAQDVQGTRAYWAARAGLEWGQAQVAASASDPPACPASPTSLPGGSATLDGGFTVSVTCSRQSHAEAGLSVHLFTLTAIARNAANPGDPGYVERSVTASLER